MIDISILWADDTHFIFTPVIWASDWLYYGNIYCTSRLSALILIAADNGFIFYELAESSSNLRALKSSIWNLLQYYWINSSFSLKLFLSKCTADEVLCRWSLANNVSEKTRHVILWRTNTVKTCCSNDNYCLLGVFWSKLDFQVDGISIYIWTIYI